jgi:D-galactosamine 6-phosphate deaminase/isomerase
MTLHSSENLYPKSTAGPNKRLLSSWTETAFLEAIGGSQPRMRALLTAEAEEKRRRGYLHTLHEILQQPRTWLDTCARMISHRGELREVIANIRSVVLTGSGTSEYAGDCVRQLLQKELGISAQVISGGALLMHGGKTFPPERPGLLISLARSGDSPESAAALSQLLDGEAGIRHLVLTCNQRGTLAVGYTQDPRVRVIVLDEATNDRSLVMTSSLTNLVLAVRYLGLLDSPQAYQGICERLGIICWNLLLTNFDALAGVGEKRFQRVVYLGNGVKHGAARESALKMLEMTAGRVPVICENYLGLRHGPMSFISDDTLVVCFLSTDITLRAYEADLLAELTRKQLGFARVLVGENIPVELVQANDVAIETPGISEVGDDNAPVIDVVVGQLLAFSRCLTEGLRPDSPSVDGVINRVVENFTVHGHQVK